MPFCVEGMKMEVFFRGTEGRKFKTLVAIESPFAF
jgi:hypothetical protein